MVNRDVLQKRIEKIREYLSFLKELRENYNITEFKQNKMIYGSGERFLHLTIESLIDIGNHIVSSENLGVVDSYRDIPVILHKNNYIEEKDRDLFIKIIGLRNILVHDYLDIEKETIYKIINESLSDLENILKNYLKLL